eukprot:jgi/Tetstr1/463292/TSEL_008216.t1
MVVNMKNARRQRGSASPAPAGRRGKSQQQASKQEDLQVTGVPNPLGSRHPNPWKGIHPADDEGNISGWSVNSASSAKFDRSVPNSPWHPVTPQSQGARGGGSPALPTLSRMGTASHLISRVQSPYFSPTKDGQESSMLRGSADSAINLSEERVPAEELGTLLVKSPGREAEASGTDSKPGSPLRPSPEDRSPLRRPQSPAPRIKLMSPEPPARLSSAASTTVPALPGRPNNSPPKQHSFATPRSGGGRTPRASRSGFSQGALLLEELEERMSELSDDFLDFMERMDRAAEGGTEGRGTFCLPPHVASAILDVGLMELSPADILLQQFDNHRNWDAAAAADLQRHKARSQAAAQGGVDKTGTWVTRRLSAGAAASSRRGGVAPETKRRQRFLQLATNFMERLRLDEDSPLRKEVASARRSMRAVERTQGPDAEGAAGDVSSWRSRSASPTRGGRGEYVKFPEFSFSGQLPVEELDRGQYMKQSAADLGEVEAKFVRDKSAAFPVGSSQQTQPLMLAATGMRRTSVQEYHRNDHLWGQEIRGVAPAPNVAPLAGQTEVLTYRGPAGAYMRHRVRVKDCAPTEQELLARQLAQYDRLMAKQEAEDKAALADDDEGPLPTPQQSSGGSGPAKRDPDADPALTRQLNMHLAAMTSLFGGFDPSDDL